MFCFYDVVIKVEASAWTRNKGETFYSLFISNYKAKKYFDNQGKKNPMTDEYRKSLFSYYFENGLTDKVTLTFKAPYARVEQGKYENEGFEEIELGFIYNIKRLEKESYSRYTNFILPARLADELEVMPLSYGKPGLEFGFSYGKNLKNGYLDSALGYRYYQGYPSSQLRTYIARSSIINKDLQMFFLLDGQFGLNDGKKKVIATKNILLDTNYKLLQIYIGPMFRYKKSFINIGYQKVLFGKNTGLGEAFYASGWYSF